MISSNLTYSNSFISRERPATHALKVGSFQEGPQKAQTYVVSNSVKLSFNGQPNASHLPSQVSSLFSDRVYIPSKLTPRPPLIRKPLAKPPNLAALGPNVEPLFSFDALSIIEDSYHLSIPDDDVDSMGQTTNPFKKKKSVLGEEYVQPRATKISAEDDISNFLKGCNIPVLKQKVLPKSLGETPLSDFITPVETPLRDLITPVRTTIHFDQTIEEALKFLRDKHIGEEIIYIYVVDDERKLLGVVPTRKLLLSEPDIPISTIMDVDLICLNSDQTLQEAMEFLETHRLLVFPVVDEKNHLLGIIDLGHYIEEKIDVANAILPFGFLSLPPL